MYCYVGMGNGRAMLPMPRSVEVQIGHHMHSGQGRLGDVQVQHGVDGVQQVKVIHGLLLRRFVVSWIIQTQDWQLLL